MSRIRFATLPSGQRLAIGEDGDGPVVICPSWWVSHLEEDLSDPQFKHFVDALSAHFRLVRYDRIGAGLSERAAVTPTLDDEVARVLFVADQVGAERFSLLGISLGSAVALSVAARHPERIERVAVCGSFADGSEVASADAQTAMLGIVRSHWGIGSRTLADVFVPSWSHEERRAFAERQKASADPETAATLLQFNYDIDVRDELSRVQAPVFVAHRKGDRAIPYRQGRLVAATVPNGEWHLVEGDAHPPWAGTDLIEPLVRFLTGPSAPWSHDRERRTLIVDGTEQSLTKLEHGLLIALVDRDGAVATRDELLEEVWGQRFAGSNVVEAVVRTLRRKLGAYSGVVETVVGHGYRFTGP